MTHVEGMPEGWEFPPDDFGALDAYFGLRTMWQTVQAGKIFDIAMGVRGFSEKYGLEPDETTHISRRAFGEVYGLEPLNVATGWGISGARSNEQQ